MFEFRQMSEELKSYCSGENIFDYYRLVEPKTHEVFKCEKDGKLQKQDEKCFGAWDRNAACPNCIARHAYVKQRQYVKLEFLYGKVLVVFAKPVSFQDKLLILELVKDITSSMMGFNYYSAENKNVENIVSQFNELAVRDILTGLYNLDYINNYITDFLQKEIAFNSLTAAAIDIDNYTQINSKYGYAVGNEVLQHIAGIMEKCAISYGGMAGRLGPDEMTIFFIDKTEEEVEDIFRNLYDDAVANPMIIRDKKLEVSFTYAIAHLRAEDEADDFIGRLYFNLRTAQGRK